MHRTIQDFVAVIFSAICFAPFFLPPGYLFAYLVDLNGFRTRSLPERLLWAISLSTPLSILLTVFSGRHVNSGLARNGVLLIAIAWVVLVAWEAWRGRLFRREDWNRPVWLVLAIAGLVCLYCVLATLGFTVGHKLYEGTYAGDWSVRVPLTAAALTSAVPITTPFYGIGGESLPLRYYYYWYALCGSAGRLASGTGRSALAASSIWSAGALFSILFLYAKYLFRPKEDEVTSSQWFSVRWLCALMLPVSCILGLDILPSILEVMVRPNRLFPEMEWWRSAGDFSLSFHTAILYAPHHTAGLSSCMLGFLMLTLCARHRGENPKQRRVLLVYSLTAALCFAAAIGTSTYLTVIFSIACTLLAVERAFARDWNVIGVIALAGIIALPLSTTYIHEILQGAGASVHSGIAPTTHARFVSFALRNKGLPRIQIIQLGGKFLHYSRPTPRWIKIVLVPVAIGVLYFIELGFFGFVLAWRTWRDLRKPARLTDMQRMQWVLVFALAFAAIFLTSQPVIGVNDLGRHAGLALRFVAVLWAAPLVARARCDPGWDIFRHTLLVRVVYATVILGLCSQLWQIVVQRSYFWLVDRRVIVYPFAPFPRFPHYGNRYFETREAFEAMEHVVPPSGRVQFNPASTYWTLISDYLERPVAAFDVDCESAFGGNIDKCHRAMPAIRGLFGGGRPLDGVVQDYDPELVSEQAFRQVCDDHRLEAIIVSASDRVWPEKQSWLWTRPAIFTNASMRVVACPHSFLKPGPHRQDAVGQSGQEKRK